MSYELLLPACFALAIGLRNYDFGPVLPACFALTIGRYHKYSPGKRLIACSPELWSHYDKIFGFLDRSLSG